MENMENLEMNEVMPTEAMMELINAHDSGTKVGAIAGLFTVGGSMVLGAALYECVVKPGVSKVSAKIANKVAAETIKKKLKKAEVADLDDMDTRNFPDNIE